MVLRGFRNKGSAVATAALLHKTVVKHYVTKAFAPPESVVYRLASRQSGSRHDKISLITSFLVIPEAWL